MGAGSACFLPAHRGRRKFAADTYTLVRRISVCESKADVSAAGTYSCFSLSVGVRLGCRLSLRRLCRGTARLRRLCRGTAPTFAHSGKSRQKRIAAINRRLVKLPSRYQRKVYSLLNALRRQSERLTYHPRSVNVLLPTNFFLWPSVWLCWRPQVHRRQPERLTYHPQKCKRFTTNELFFLAVG